MSTDTGEQQGACDCARVTHLQGDGMVLYFNLKLYCNCIVI